MRKKLFIALALSSTLAWCATRYIDVIKSQLASFVLIEETELVVGTNTDTDIKLSVDNGDANNPFIFYDASSNAFGAANDGSTEDIFALLDAAQVLTNKTFDDAITLQELGSTPTSPASGYKKLYAKNDGLVYTLNNSGEEVPVGSGSGQGGINYITNPDAEINGNDWSAYSDAAAATPEDGTGGSPTVTITRNTTTPLRGEGDFVITKDAADRQGEGVSTAFTINNFDKSSIAYIKFDYSADDDDYEDDDIRIYIYDVTNAQVIEPVNRDLKAGNGTHVAFFQTASDSTSYRLIFHIATTEAAAYDVYFDNVTVGPVSDKALPSAAAMSDWKDYTPTTQGLGAVSGVDFRYRRIGSSVEIQGQLVAGTPTGVEAQIGLPPGLTIASNAGSLQVAGFGTTNVTTVTFADYGVLMTSGDTFLNIGLRDGTRNALSAETGSNVLSAGVTFSISASVPIQGWSAGGQSDVAFFDASRPVEVIASGQTNAAIANGNEEDLVFGTVAKDTHSAYNNTTGIFTSPKSGYYTVHAATEYTPSSPASGDRGRIILYKNSTAIARNFQESQSSAAGVVYSHSLNRRVYLEKGDTLKIAFNCEWNETITFADDDERHWFTISSSGSNSLAVSPDERVYVEGRSNGAASITADVNNITFTETQDSHGAWDGQVFTAPRADWYSVKGMVRSSAGVASWFIRAYISGSFDLALGHKESSTQFITFSGDIYLNKGQELSFRSSDSFTESASSTTHWVVIRTK